MSFSKGFAERMRALLHRDVTEAEPDEEIRYHIERQTEKNIGVRAQVTKHRTREMGIRIALGAHVQQVRWLIVRHGMRLTAIGLVVGAGLAVIATRAMAGLLFKIPVTDPITFGGVAALVAAAGLMASLLPAIQAGRADPAVALRGE